jgi:hypothetical protein
MYSIRIKTLTEKTQKQLEKSAELHKRLKQRRERLQSRSKQRTQEWIDGLDADDAKNIVQGAMRQSASPNQRAGMSEG